MLAIQLPLSFRTSLNITGNSHVCVTTMPIIRVFLMYSQNNADTVKKTVVLLFFFSV